MYFKDISRNFKIMSRAVFVRKQSLTIIIAAVIFALLEDYSGKLKREGKDFLNRIRAYTKKIPRLVLNEFPPER